jgi:esterase/lipase superfamily enzyme
MACQKDSKTAINMKITFIRRIVLFVIAAWLVSASGTSVGNEKPDQQKKEKTPVSQTVSFVTLRNKTGESAPGDMFGDDRDLIRTGQCELIHTPFSLPQSLTLNGLVYIPDELIKLEAVSEHDTVDFWRNLKNATQRQRPILYLHGYNMSFARGCKQASLFQTNLNLGKRLVLFSWPSDGALLNYARDEADLFWSVAPLEAVLEQMLDQFGAGGFDVVAHSLGARGLYLALVQLAHRHHERLPLLNQLVLTAPDIDAGIFKQYLPDVRPLARNITLYVSDNDRPLALSQEVHGYPRLGESGPHLNNIEGVEIIDITDIGVRSFSGHLYHLYHDIVVHDLNLLLNDGLHASRREVLVRTDHNRWRLRAVEAN